MNKLQKVCLSALSLSAAALVGCGVDSSSSGSKQEVSVFEKLPACSATKDAAGLSTLGQKFYVEEEEAYYVCTNNGWTETDSSSVVDTTTASYVIEADFIKGQASFGGSFKVDSRLVLRELKLNAKTGEFQTTGTEIVDEISGDDGSFVIPDVRLTSPYVEIEVTGLFNDVLQGEVSEDSVSLKGFFLLDDSSEPTVNVLSVVEYPRVKALVKKGYSVKAAVAQAEKEIASILGYTDLMAEDGATSSLDFALQVLLRQENTAEEFLETLNEFAEDLEDGLWDDEDARVQIADFAYNFENKKYVDEEYGLVRISSATYHKNYQKLEGKDAPAFEAFVNKFWNAVYGLGVCGSSREAVVVKNLAEDSDSAETYFICLAGNWAIADTMQRDTFNLGDDYDGALKNGLVYDKLYQYDTLGMGAGTPTRWRDADDLTIRFDMACTDAEDVRGRFKVIEDDIDSFFVCKDRMWSMTDKNTYDIGYLCDSTSKGVYEKLAKKDTTLYFRCGDTYGSWIWEMATETDYNTRELECLKDELVTVGRSDLYSCQDVSARKFREATENEEKVGLPCNVYQMGDTTTVKSVKYTCGCQSQDFVDDHDSTTTPATYLGFHYELIVDSTKTDDCGYNVLDWIDPTTLVTRY